MASACAVVVGIQTYQQPGLPGIDYAHADARAIAAVLAERCAVPQANIRLWLDQDATAARLGTELRSLVSNLSQHDRFYFYYAGHGLWAPQGGNRLTAWDSQPGDLQATTVSLEDVLLTPLRRSRVSQSAIFIDAGAAGIHQAPGAAEMLAGLKAEEFAAFVNESPHAAAFLACSSEESSYSSHKLQHGVWSHALARALRGEEPGAIHDGKYITATSLQDYLHTAVRQFTRTEFVRKAAVQTPYAEISQNGSFILVTLPEPAADARQALVAPDFSDAYFSGEDTRRFNSFKEFTWKKKHTVPTEHSASAAAWARRLLGEEVARELQEVAMQAREVLKVRSKDIEKVEGTGSGTVATDAFRFEIEADQSAEDPGQTVVRRAIRLRVPHAKLPRDFDAIFPGAVDTFCVTVPGTKGRYAELLDAIEEWEAEAGARSEGDQTQGTIEIRLGGGTRLVIDTKHETMRVQVSGATGCLALIEGLGDGVLAGIAGAAPGLIGRKP